MLVRNHYAGMESRRIRKYWLARLLKVIGETGVSNSLTFSHETIQLLIILFLFGNLNSIAQTVTNLRFEQSAKMIDVYYDLSGKDNESIEVKIYCSQDGGNSWGTPLQYVTGAVGEKVKQGFGKKITWDVLKETQKLTGEIKFKIDAMPDKIEVIPAALICRSITVTHTAGSQLPPLRKQLLTGWSKQTSVEARNAGLPRILELIDKLNRQTDAL